MLQLISWQAESITPLSRANFVFSHLMEAHLTPIERLRLFSRQPQQQSGRVCDWIGQNERIDESGQSVIEPSVLRDSLHHTKHLQTATQTNGHCVPSDMFFGGSWVSPVLEFNLPELYRYQRDS
jgi:hypothetical protein